jgi:predicted GIY-YIG superfamily endonuclease
MLIYLLIILITAHTVTSFYSRSQSFRSRYSGVYQISPKKITSKAIRPKLNGYHNATIYQLVCYAKNATSVYIGHTTNFKTRMSIHKYECNHEEGRNYNLPLYKYMRANGGCDNWEMIALEICSDKEEALRKEREWILKTPLAINKGRPLILNRLITKLIKDYDRKRKEMQMESKR